MVFKLKFYDSDDVVLFQGSGPSSEVPCRRERMASLEGICFNRHQVEPGAPCNTDVPLLSGVADDSAHGSSPLGRLVTE
eukprot:747591-Hanusia_phi.AAC.9